MSTERAPINVILRGEHSGGQIAIMDNVVGAGFPGPPLHHHGFDETFYVLKGELTFQLEDELFTRKEGELAFAPRDVPHTFAGDREHRPRRLGGTAAAPPRLTRPSRENLYPLDLPFGGCLSTRSPSTIEGNCFQRWRSI